MEASMQVQAGADNISNTGREQADPILLKAIHPNSSGRDRIFLTSSDLFSINSDKEDSGEMEETLKQEAGMCRPKCRSAWKKLFTADLKYSNGTKKRSAYSSNPE